MSRVYEVDAVSLELKGVALSAIWENPHIGSVTPGGRSTVTTRRFPAMDGTGTRRLKSGNGF